MIYKDSKASGDTEDKPADRHENCLNCNFTWSAHNGWACPSKNMIYYNKKFRDIPGGFYYMTRSMSDSLNAGSWNITFPWHKTIPDTIPDTIPSGVAETKDLPEWKIYRNDRHGECACGIVRSTCDYHR